MKSPVLICSSLLLLISGQLAPEPVDRELSNPSPIMVSSSNGAVVQLKNTNETWTILGDQNGIIISRKTSSGIETIRPKALQSLLRVNRIAAVTNGWSGEQRAVWYIGMAIECLNAKGDQFDYYMCEGRLWTTSFPKIQIEMAWHLSNPITSRAINRPVRTLAAGLPGGDSLMMTLQDYVRNYPNGPDSIETHTYVNHCPGNEPVFSKLTQHYMSSDTVRVAESISNSVTSGEHQALSNQPTSRPAQLKE
ncbi:hypothetical protein RAS2_32820 [Phycisphaerae bacterium RAS2]|nr:hypothetical protein RAS2_32820 [Phycisphaerae bacterium RAS2]